MTILEFIVLVVVIGVALYLICRFVPMQPAIQNTLVICVVIIVVLVFLNVIGVLGYIDRPIPRVR